MKNEKDLETILLGNFKIVKSQPISSNAPLKLEHSCTTEENRCTLLQCQARNDNNGVHIITHEHRDYGKVDLSHLNNYTRLLSMTHYECKEAKPVSIESQSQTKDEHCNAKPNEEGLTEKQVSLKSPKVTSSEKNQLEQLHQLRQLLYKNGVATESDCLSNSNSDNFKSKELQRKKPQRNVNDLEVNYLNYISTINTKESTETQNNRLLLSPKVTKQITIDDCLQLSSSSNYKKLLSRYKNSLTSSNDSQPTSNRLQMLKMSEPLMKRNDLKKVQPSSNKSSWLKMNKKCMSYTMNKPLKAQATADTPRFRWWLYYNSIIYPSNAMEDSIFKIEKSLSFK